MNRRPRRADVSQTTSGVKAWATWTWTIAERGTRSRPASNPGAMGVCATSSDRYRRTLSRPVRSERGAPLAPAVVVSTLTTRVCARASARPCTTFSRPPMCGG